MNYIVNLLGCQYSGTSLNKSDWRKVPETPIKSLIYNIGDMIITLHGYLKYNHLVEHCVEVGGNDRITAIYLMGQNINHTDVIKFDLVLNKMFSSTTWIDHEYKDAPVSGWKTGADVGSGKFEIGALK